MDRQRKSIALIFLALGVKKKVERKMWVKKWLRNREKYSHLVLLKQLNDSDPEEFKNYFRMNGDTFQKLVQMIQPFFKSQNTNMRRCISAEEKLAVTLRYLATGRSVEDLKFSAVMSPSSVSNAIKYTCEVLIFILQDYMKFPSTSSEWEEIASDFGALHDFYNTCGALDGKHIEIERPAKSGSLYYNYKGFYSIVLLALVNAKKEFIMIDAGINGRISDGGVMHYSKFGEFFQQQKLKLPPPAPLPNATEPFPYVFVADEAFGLDLHLLKPYSQKSLDTSGRRHHFNKRLSRARVTVENTFGILSSRFGVFQSCIKFQPRHAQTITMACCYLHNFLSKENNESYFISNPTDPPIQDALVGLGSTLTRNSVVFVKKSRDKFCDYYNDNDGNIN